jgi:hypothetical protein
MTPLLRKSQAWTSRQRLKRAMSAESLSGTFNHEDGPWTTTIEVKGDECTYLASHNSGHFTKIVGKKELD